MLQIFGSIFLCVLACILTWPSVDGHIDVRNPFHPGFTPGIGDHGGLSVLVVAVDNRILNKDAESAEGYISSNAILQHRYCVRHGYDYVRVSNDKRNLTSQIKIKYPDSLKQKFQEKLLDSTGNSKYGTDVFHPGYLRGRASSWGKLPALWYTLEQIGHRYDYIWFMDSDATPNPLLRSHSLSQALERWSSNTTHWVKWGKVPPKDATFLFMSNFPYRDDLPCAGTIIIKPSQLAKDAIREWWDYDLIYKAQADFMEQDALWYMIDGGPSYHFLINENSTVLLTEQQFLSPWHGYGELWFTHIPSGNEGRTAYLRTMLRVHNLHQQHRFERALNTIRRHCIFSIPFLAITEQMEALRVAPHRQSWPMEIEERVVDQQWHEARQLDLRPPTPPVGSLYTGFVLQRAGSAALYLIYNNSKHAFGNYWLFCEKLGYDNAMVVKTNTKHRTQPYENIDLIPEGEPVPNEGVPGITRDFESRNPIGWDEVY